MRKLVWLWPSTILMGPRLVVYGLAGSPKEPNLQINHKFLMNSDHLRLEGSVITLDYNFPLELEETITLWKPYLLWNIFIFFSSFFSGNRMIIFAPILVRVSYKNVSPSWWDSYADIIKVNFLAPSNFTLQHFAQKNVPTKLWPVTRRWDGDI